MPHRLKQCLQGLSEMPLETWDVKGISNTRVSVFHQGILLTPRRELEKNVHSRGFLDEIHVLKQPFNKLGRKKKNTIKALLRGGGLI